MMMAGRPARLMMMAGDILDSATSRATYGAIRAALSLSLSLSLSSPVMSLTRVRKRLSDVRNSPLESQLTILGIAAVALNIITTLICNSVFPGSS
jgi:hypothetical protein